MHELISALILIKESVFCFIPDGVVRIMKQGCAMDRPCGSRESIHSFIFGSQKRGWRLPAPVSPCMRSFIQPFSTRFGEWRMERAWIVRRPQRFCFRCTVLRRKFTVPALHFVRMEKQCLAETAISLPASRHFVTAPFTRWNTHMLLLATRRPGQKLRMASTNADWLSV